MANLQKFMLGGLDIKSNDLVRDPMRSSDLLNVTKTINGDIDKRNGYEAVETFASLQESCYYKTLDQDVFVKTDGTIWKPYGGSRQSCSIASLFPTGNVIYTEYLSSLYLTTSDGKSPVVKYDGSSAYLAGLPAPISLFAGGDATISSPGDGYFYRFFYSFRDLNGSIIYSPYHQMKSTVNNATITVSSFKTSNSYGAFYNKYLIADVSISGTVDNSVPGTSNKLAYTSTNFAVGDKIVIDTQRSTALIYTTSTTYKFKAITISAISGGFITFDINDLSDFSFIVLASVNIDTSLLLDVFRSSSESFGYVDVRGTTIAPIDNSQDNYAISAVTAINGQLLENVYDVDKQKLRPPVCKYLTSLGDQLVYGNIIGVWDQLNIFTQYNNKSIVLYSDFGFSDSGEGHSANIQKIGESYDGSITGLRRCNDLLIVTKDNSIFAMDGVLEPGGYSLRRVPTNYIGCQSHNSIMSTEGGLFFHGNDGIYYTDGVNCSKMTQIIDPFFINIDTTKTRAAIDSRHRKYFFYMTDNSTQYCLVYSYEFKEWLIWDSLDMSKGLYQKNNKDVYFAKGTKTYKFNATYTDDTATVINGVYKSNWEDLKNPSIDKKFKYIRIWNLNSVDTTFNLAVQKNWVNTDLHPVTCTIPARGSIQKGFEQMNVQAIRFVFSNNIVAQNMLITAYEIQYEVTQAIDKGN
jgi:hypothetical protein